MVEPIATIFDEPLYPKQQVHRIFRETVYRRRASKTTASAPLRNSLASENLYPTLRGSSCKLDRINKRMVLFLKNLYVVARGEISMDAQYFQVVKVS
ncbi:MAG: hypothetical protein ACLUKN_05480 [Bacilli bacterium]